MLAAFLTGILCGFCLLVLSLGPWLKKKAQLRSIIELDGKKYRVEEINGDM